MKKATQTVLEPGDDDSEAIPPTVEEVEDTALERVAAMLRDSTTKDAVVKIYRKNPTTGRMQWIDEMPPAQMEEQGYASLRRRFGPGVYQVIIYGTNPATGVWARRGGQTVELAEDHSPPPAQTTNGDLSSLMEMLDRRFAAIEARIATPPPTKTARESLEELALMVQMMRELNPPAPPPPPPPDMLGLVEKLGSLVGGVRDLRDAIEPTPEPKNPLMAIAAQMLPMIQGAIMNQGPAQPAMLPAAAAPAPAAPPAARNVTQLRPPAPPASIVQSGEEGAAIASAATAATTPGAEVSEEQRAAIDMARTYIEQLDTMAKFDAQIEPTAEFLYQFIDDETEKMLRSDYWWPMIVNLKPEAAEREKWYRELHARLIEILDEPAPKTAA